MKYEFRDKTLERAYTSRDEHAGLSDPVLRGFRKCMQIIDQADSELVFYAMKSLHFEKLKGDRSHQRSMRIDNRWRLILEMEGKGDTRKVVIVEVVDYH